MMGKAYPIFACNGTNHARHFIDSQYILLQPEARVFYVNIEKRLDR